MPATWSIIHGTEIRKRGRGITIGGTLYFWRQLVIVVLVGIVALYFTLIAFGNITDYGTNFAFVKHVMGMDTTFRDGDLMWRAITNSILLHLSYAGLILWETATAVVCWIATVLTIRSFRQSGTAFESARRFTILGLLMSILLWAGAFLTIGGEWFAMWQSETWNGTEPAVRNFTVSGIALIIVLLVGDTGQQTIE